MVLPLDPPSIGGARQALALRHLCFLRDKSPVADRYDYGKPVLKCLAADRVGLERMDLGDRDGLRYFFTPHSVLILEVCPSLGYLQMFQHNGYCVVEIMVF